ncbi:hypothetical protein evm_012880 [Chilo suppressalis]|nr:hypothetical protein evm_012880 [Chilo suppressalis]
MNFCSRDLCAVKLTLNQDNNSCDVIIASAYMPDSERAPPENVASLVRFCARENVELIIATDSNAHHPVWGMEQSNNRGNQLFEFLLTTNLELINTGNEPTFVGRRCKTIIDLTLATPRAATAISGWHVSNEASCSDHRWIRFTLQVGTLPPTPQRYPRKTDKHRYAQLLADLLRNNSGKGRIETTEQLEQQGLTTTSPPGEPLVRVPVGKPRCPPAISRLRVEKVEGGLAVAGVVVAANCQIVLPIFGFLFMLVGCVLTAASYRGCGENEEPDHYAARIAFTGNSRVLGPVCIVAGAIMTLAGIVLCMLMRAAQRRQRRLAFHCPIHGDFYPLSPQNSRKYSRKIFLKSLYC